MFARTALGRGLSSVRPTVRFASSSAGANANANAGGAFGNTRREAFTWFAKATAVCGVAGFTLANVLTDERMAQWKVPFFGEAHAFAILDDGMHAHSLPFDHKSMFKSYDHAALRRGYQVYREVCAACHSMNLIHWRNLVGVTHTEAEAKAMAAEYEYQDGPDDKGEMFMRPGKLTDPMPSPYPNEEAARAANGGAYPPDLSCIARARHGEEDYIWNLLLGYTEPPPGVTLRDGLHFNRYFPGGAISMARSIYDEVVDYEDGTPNNASQIAKDISVFLAWASYPEFDERKKLGLKAIALSSVMLVLSVWWKRHKWSYVKSRKIAFKPPKSIVDV
ncbi:cytochrome c1 [Blyttiomyces sp. JEL0837]|nr:cytochrome c1 [Blyttiomyces sp. JEL0837]